MRTTVAGSFARVSEAGCELATAGTAVTFKRTGISIGLFPAVGLLGVLWALVLKVSKPDVYQTIGLGANTVTGITTQSRVVQGQYTAQHAGQDTYR